MERQPSLLFLKQHLLDPLLSFVFPSLCVVCSTPLKNNDACLCKTCLNDLTLLDPGYVCAIKEEIKSPYFDKLYIIYEFDTVFQTLIHLLKYQHFTDISRLLAKALLTEITGKYDFTSAVPLNSVRLRERGYNQSALIAGYFAQERALPFSADLIERIKNTPSQTKLNREQRIENMKDAFICRQNLNGRNILLIDDVITTGSTLNACAQVLKAAGAKRVDIGALATPVGIFQKNMERAGIKNLEISNKSS